jgi:hypothetical protein
MSTIGSRIFAEGEDKYMTLAGEEYVRPLAIGNNWNTIQFGCLYSFGTDGTNNLTSAMFTMGLCSGVNRGWGSLVSNWIGASLTTSFGVPVTWNYFAGPPPYFQLPAGASVGVSVNGVPAQYGSAGSAWNLVTNTGSPQRKQMMAVRIVKGSPAFTVNLIRPPGGASAINYSFTEFIYFMENTTMTWSWNSQTWINFGGSGTFNETAGPVDTVSIYWNKQTVPVEIHAVAAYRFA